MTDFSQLKEQIPFDLVRSKSWLLEPTTIRLKDHATHLFKAEKLADVWTNPKARHLHAVVYVRERCTSFTLAARDRWLTPAIYIQKGRL